MSQSTRTSLNNTVVAQVTARDGQTDTRKGSQFLLGLLAVTAMFVAVPAFADDDDRYRDRYNDRHERTAYARVISATPVVQWVNASRPEQQCWDEQVRHRSGKRSKTPQIVGGIVGGAVGYHLGNRKSNKRTGAVLGAILGASIGKDASRERRRDDYRVEQVCERMQVSYQREEVVGYDVTYKYQGRRYQTFMDYHPGKRIPVEVSVRPSR